MSPASSAFVYQNRVEFHRGDAEIAPGISVHRIGGHTAGLQCVRVHTARGWVVLASDASHYYEHFEQERCFPLVYHMGEMLEGLQRCSRSRIRRDTWCPGTIRW